MDNSSQCDQVIPGYVGPLEAHEILGWWSISMYTILGLHALPIFVFSAVTWRRLRSSTSNISSRLLYLLSIPLLLVSITSAGILFPFSGKYLETLLEVVISLGIVQFIGHIIDTSGGMSQFVENCLIENIPINFGSPPFVCLLPLKQSMPTKRSISLIKWGPIFLFCVKISILSVDLIYFILDYHQSGYYLDLDNIHYILSIPAGLLGIYGFNILLNMFNVLLKSNTKRHLGSILLVEYILFDVLRIFFLFLSGTGILNCLPPLFTSQDTEHLLKNIMKAFLATWIGGPFLKFCSESHGEAIIKMTKDSSDGSINNNRDLPVTAKVRTCGLDNLALSGE